MLTSICSYYLFFGISIQKYSLSRWFEGGGEVGGVMRAVLNMKYKCLKRLSFLSDQFNTREFTSGVSGVWSVCLINNSGLVSL